MRLRLSRGQLGVQLHKGMRLSVPLLLRRVRHNHHQAQLHSRHRLPPGPPRNRGGHLPERQVRSPAQCRGHLQEHLRVLRRHEVRGQALRRHSHRQDRPQLHALHPCGGPHDPWQQVGFLLRKGNLLQQ